MVVHPGYYLKSTVFLKKKFCKSSLMMRKVKWQDSTMDFFEAMKGETVLCQRIIGAMPHEIHQIYLQERENFCNSPKN
jgi:hypothetical protein